jgi:hypothetical protein
MMRMRRPLVIAAAVALVAAVATVALTVAAGPNEARATLPPDLERSLTSPEGDRPFAVDPASSQKVVLGDGTEVFLVSGDGGAACIGLADGSAACGPGSQVASGHLFLITIPAAGGPEDQPSPIPAKGSAEATVYGYQPKPGAAWASIVGAEGQVLGRGKVVDGIYRAGRGRPRSRSPCGRGSSSRSC